MKQCNPQQQFIETTSRGIVTDYRPLAKQITTDYTNMMYAWYLDDLWGMEVGYRVHPEAQVLMQKWLLDWQRGSDCGKECTASLNQPVIVATMATITQSVPCSIYTPLNAYLRDNCCEQGRNQNNGQSYFTGR